MWEVFVNADRFATSNDIGKLTRPPDCFCINCTVSSLSILPYIISIQRFTLVYDLFCTLNSFQDIRVISDDDSPIPEIIILTRTIMICTTSKYSGLLISLASHWATYKIFHSLWFLYHYTPQFYRIRIPLIPIFDQSIFITGITCGYPWSNTGTNITAPNHLYDSVCLSASAGTNIIKITRERRRCRYEPTSTHSDAWEGQASPATLWGRVAILNASWCFCLIGLRSSSARSCGRLIFQYECISNGRRKREQHLKTQISNVRTPIFLNEEPWEHQGRYPFYYYYYTKARKGIYTGDWQGRIIKKISPFIDQDSIHAAFGDI